MTMFTLPERIDGGTPGQPTGLSCPDCHGVLAVRAEGRRGHLTLICRIGHVYSLPELLASAEDRLDQSLWMALLTVQEFHDLLDDLHGRADRGGLGRAARLLAERRERARDTAAMLRRTIENNRGLEIVDEMDEIGADGEAQ